MKYVVQWSILGLDPTYCEEPFDSREEAEAFIEAEQAFDSGLSFLKPTYEIIEVEVG